MTVTAPTPTKSEPASPSRAGVLAGLVGAYKGRLLITYALFNLENLLRLAQPWVLGLAINGLMHSSYVELIVLVVQHLAHLLVGTLRRMYDTRAFTSIYTELATGLVGDQRGRKVAVSRVAARSALSREFVEFLERHVPVLFRSSYSVVGALVFLGLYDWMLVPLCLALAVPAYLLNRI